MTVHTRLTARVHLIDQSACYYPWPDKGKSSVRVAAKFYAFFNKLTVANFALVRTNFLLFCRKLSAAIFWLNFLDRPQKLATVNLKIVETILLLLCKKLVTTINQISFLQNPQKLVGTISATNFLQSQYKLACTNFDLVLDNLLCGTQKVIRAKSKIMPTNFLKNFNKIVEALVATNLLDRPYKIAETNHRLKDAILLQIGKKLVGDNWKIRSANFLQGDKGLACAATPFSFYRAK